MKRFLLIALMLTSLFAQAQKKYTVSTDDKTGLYVFRGPITFEDLKGEKTFKWFDESLDGYKPEYDDLRYLADKLKQYKLIIFMGTWCDDSHYLIPKLYALLQKAYYPVYTVEMYGVDRDKNAGGDEKTKYKISKVPTIIVLKDDREIGRITEAVAQSIEHDLADILKLNK